MVTKAKAKSESNTKTAAHPLAEEFGKAVKLFDAGKHGEAAKAFEALVAQAQEGGHWHLKRSAQGYLATCQRHTQTPKEPKRTPEVEAQMLLNGKDAEGAMKVLDKALKAHADHAKLHYLKAVALAQLDQEEPCAASLKAALDLDPDLTYQFRMEPDFEDMRDHPAFGFALGR